MKKILKKIIRLSLYLTGMNKIKSSFMQYKVFCIGYHSVFSKKNENILQKKLYSNISISSEKFEEQILYLKKNGHNFTTFDGLKNAISSGLKKPTIIFFDDGFKDVLLNAMPILQKYSIPAVVFITTDLASKSGFLWTLGFRDFLFREGKDEKYIERKIGELKKLSMQDRNKKIEEMYSENNFSIKPEDYNVFLNWEEIVNLSKNNFEIGSHSVSHNKLSEIDEVSLEKEIFDSKEIIEEKIGKKIVAISYPHGRKNDSVLEKCKKAGYNFGITTLDGANEMDYIKNNPFAIKRINPESWEDIADFSSRLYFNL